MEVEADGPLKACTGISLQSEDGKSTALSKILNLVQPWMQNGSIHVFKSVLEKLVFKIKSNGEVVVQDSSCSEAGNHLQARGQSCCKACLLAADRGKTASCIKDWCLRIAWVDLTHLILQEDTKEVANHVEFMKATWPELAHEPLLSLTYREAFNRARNFFQHIPLSVQSASLKAFVSRNLRYLTPVLVCGAAGDVQKQARAYVVALESGKVAEHEKEAIASSSVWIKSRSTESTQKQ